MSVTFVNNLENNNVSITNNHLRFS